MAPAEVANSVEMVLRAHREWVEQSVTQSVIVNAQSHFENQSFSVHRQMLFEMTDSHLLEMLQMMNRDEITPRKIRQKSLDGRKEFTDQFPTTNGRSALF